MIEAVNSVLANASLLRGPAEQTADISSLSRAAPVRSEAAGASVEGPKAPFVSPFIEVDVNYNTAVLQFPSEERLQAQARRSDNESAVQAQDSGRGGRVNQDTASSAASANAQETAPVGVSFVSFGIDSGESSSSSEPSFAGVPEAQVAAAALSSGARAGQPTSSGVSVAA